MSCDEFQNPGLLVACNDLEDTDYTAVCVKPSSLEVLAERGVLHTEIPST